MITTPACPVCGGDERTEVSPWNGLVLLRSHCDEDAARYAYALCHRCGVVYAGRRPTGAEFVTLLENFDDNLGRVDRPNLGVTEGSLTEDERGAVRRRMRRGWLVSDERPPGDDEWWPMLRFDRLSTAQDLALLASSVDLRGARVLDVRTNAGALLDSLRSWFGCDVYALPAFEADQLVIEEYFGIPAARLIDFEDFEIPYDGPLDVVLAKHMLTHALRPDAFLAEVKAHLRPGGHLYLYVENDDHAMWGNRKNLLGELKCFHFQNFDLPALTRALRAHGFEPEWVIHVSRSSMSCLARLDPAVRFAPIGPRELEDRLELYRRWYDLSVLSLPPELPREPFAHELDAIADRAIARGDAERHGRLVRPRKRLKLMHEEGYVELNRRLAAVDGDGASNGGARILPGLLRSAAGRVRSWLG